MGRLIRQPFIDVMAALEHLVTVRRPQLAMFMCIASLAVTWVVYVPIHELLHALGCLATGGSVTELQIAPMYGGGWLADWIPFVVSGGEYAGRLSGFDTHGYDWIYLATDFAPYLLTIVLGVPLMRLCARRWRPMLLGSGIVIGMAPFYNIIGDYYEMGSITTTALLGLAQGADTIPFVKLRSDDIFKLVGSVITEPDTLGLAGALDIVWALLIIATSFTIGIGFAFITYYVGHQFARLIIRGSIPPALSSPDATPPSSPVKQHTVERD